MRKKKRIQYQLNCYRENSRIPHYVEIVEEEKLDKSVKRLTDNGFDVVIKKLKEDKFK